MFKVTFSWKVLDKIDDFIENYLNSYKERFSDTGIFTEEIILNSYIKKSEKLKEEIYDSTKDIFGNTEILGYKPLKNNRRKSGITVGNYRIFIEYSEDFNNKIRVIEKIEFHKK